MSFSVAMDTRIELNRDNEAQLSAPYLASSSVQAFDKEVSSLM